jgi:hypothetical protein
LLLFQSLDLTEWGTYRLALKSLVPFANAASVEEIQERLDIIAHNERMSRGTRWPLTNPAGLLIANLQGKTRAIPMDGYKSRTDRLVEEQKRRAEQSLKNAQEIEQLHRDAELLRWKATLTAGQLLWITREAARRIAERTKGPLKMPDTALAAQVRSAEAEVLAERYELSKVGKPVPE